MKKKSVPSITRVHALHRIRTVVNQVTLLSDKGIQVDDMAIAEHLIATQLSKASVTKIKDQIGRRARDHLETARYLGLVYRKKAGTKFAHFPTDLGRALSKYDIIQECPSDTLEEAIFVDRICRFKVANTSYLQEAGGHYADFRNRLCLSILASLEQSHELNLYQVAAIVSELVLTPSDSKQKLSKTVTKVLSVKWEKAYFQKLTGANKSDIARDTLPFLDWCKHVGLILEKTDSNPRTYSITTRGKIVFNYYRSSIPIWWASLGPWAEFASAAVILFNYLQVSNRPELISKLSKFEVKAGLFEKGTIDSIIREVTGLTLKQISNQHAWFDFSMSYDVPPERLEFVRHQLQQLLLALCMKTSLTKVIHDVEWAPIDIWSTSFKQDASESSEALSQRLNIKAVLPTASIQYHFQSDYEAATYVFLQQLQQTHFKVAKYQGQLIEYFANEPHWTRMARTNPDLIVTNGFLSLIECKSVKEWGSKLIPNKSVVSELMMYSQFVSALSKQTGPSVKCRVVISYEGDIEPKDFQSIHNLLQTQCSGVIIVLRSALQKALTNQTAKNELRGRMALATGYADARKLILD